MGKYRRDALRDKKITDYVFSRGNSAFWLIDCNSKGNDAEQLISELFYSLYSVDEAVLTEYKDCAADSASDEFYAALYARFSPYFTYVAKERFFENRQCDFLMKRIENYEISTIDALDITEKSSDEGNAKYLVKGSISYTSENEQQDSEFSAEVCTVLADGEWKVDSLFFTSIP